NYDLALVDGNLTITKATLDIIADDKSRVYNTANPVFTLSYSGFLNGDTSADIDVLPTASTAATTSSDVGSYVINLVGGTDNNYTFTLNNGTLIINKATASVTVANETVTYDGTSKSASITTNPSGLNVNATYNGSATLPVNAGVYSVSVSINETNYEGSGTGTLTIDKAMALVSISNLYQNFDGSAKPVTITTNPVGLTVTTTYNGSSSVPSAIGSYTVQADIVDNNYFGSASNTLVINGPPTSNGISNVNVLEDAGNEVVNLNAAFDDVEDIDDNLIFTISNNTNAGLFTSTVIANGLLTLDFAPDQFGSATITIRAEDTGGLFVEDSFTVNVSAVEDDPIFTSTPVTGAVQDQLYQYNITTSDADPGEVLTITALIALPSWLSLTDNGDGTALLSGTPTNADAGNTFGIALGVSDDEGNNNNQFFNINVTNSNDTPFFTSTPNTSATEDISYTYFINTDDDDTGDVLTLSAPVLPTWLALTDNGDGTGQISGVPDNTAAGANTVQLRVTDNAGAFANQDFVITVNNANDPPTFTSTPILSVNEDSPYNYSITTSDPDAGDVLTIKALSKPSWLTLTDNGDGTGTLSGTPQNSNVGNSSIVLNVEDSEGASVNQNFTLTVNNTNDPPQFTSTPVTAALQDGDYTYNIATSDPDVGDTRTITGVTVPSWLTLTDNGNGTAKLTGSPGNGDLGANSVKLRVTDNAGLSVDQDFVINVDNANDPPAFSSTPVTIATEDQLYNYNITTTDPDAGDTRVITALSIPGWLTLVDNGNGTASLSGTPTNSNVGSFSIVLNVRDALGEDANQNFTLVVNNTNDDPVFESSPVTSAVQSVAYTYNILADDPDAGDVVDLSVPTLPSWLSFTNNGNGSGTLSGTPQNTDLGSHNVVVNAADQNGSVVSQSFTITVDNANDPPQFTSTPVTAVDEDDLYTYNVTTSDPDVGDVLEIQELVLPNWLTLTDNGDGTAVLSGTPLNSNVGVADVVIEVSDAQGLSVNQNFSIEVSNTNDPPVFVSSPVTGAIQNQSYNYNVVTSDPDFGETRSIAASTIPGWLSLTDNGNGTASLTGTPTNANLGANNVTLEVTDQSGATTTQSFIINVDNINDPPTFTSTPVTNATEDQPYEYTVTTSDPDVGDTRTITSLSIPNWLTLSDNGDGTAVLSGTPLNADVGNFTVVLNVKDAVGANVNQNFTINVANTNDPPVFTSDPKPVAVQDIEYVYNITTSDPDVGDSRSISALTLPTWLAFTDNGNGTAELIGTPTNTDLGSHQISLKVEDASGTSTEQNFTINVDNANDPPSFTSTPITAVAEDDLYSYAINTTDPDVGDIQTITALSKPSWLTLTDNGDGTADLFGTPKNENVGTVNVVLNVEDGIGANVNQSFNITVTNTNDAPGFTSSPVTGAIQDLQYTYNIQTNDPDVGDAVTITAVTIPAWLTLTDNGNGTGTLQGTPSNANLGSNNVSLKVTDQAGAAVNQVFVINVDNQNDPPLITSSPVLSVDEDNLYTYNVTSSDPDVGDTRDIIALSKPSWLTLTDNGDGTAILQGTPLNEDVGADNVVIKVVDAIGAEDDQTFTITINNVNDAPAFTSSPVISAQQDISYQYNITTSDPDVGDSRTITSGALPSFLTLVDNGNGTAELSGTPQNSDLGSYQITLTVEDAGGAAIDQIFTLTV
ncbi:adhesin, partial [Fulvivirga sp. RKSG066]|uniref:beta strand repeat-containing protein n=1 Tax=Fulvivirga aurantia TaxID=2529383 RepID=UPI0016293201